jgi:kinesin family protein 2/24
MALCKLQQKEFLSRCLQTPGVDRQQAVTFYQKFWRLQIDCRQRASKASTNKDVEVAPEPVKVRDKTPFQGRIKPGMFIRLKPGVARYEGINLVMIMSPATREDFENEGEERRFICALVGPSIMTEAYELHVERQDTLYVKDMAAEVLMEYDLATRYYYMDL